LEKTPLHQQEEAGLGLISNRGVMMTTMTTSSHSSRKAMTHQTKKEEVATAAAAATAAKASLLTAATTKEAVTAEAEVERMKKKNDLPYFFPCFFKYNSICTRSILHI
jgi:hypothetical protein